jgi:hypothetical protein
MSTNCLQVQLIILELKVEFMETTGANQLMTNKENDEC